MLIKRLRRKFRRQVLAKERDERIRCEENDPLYQAWIEQKEIRRKQREIDEEKEM